MINRATIAVAGAVSAAIVLSLTGAASASQDAAGHSLAAASARAAQQPANTVYPTFLSRGPAVAADRRGHQIYVFWASPTGELDEAWSSDGVNNWQQTSLPQMGTLYSQPSVVTTNQDQNGHSWQYVYWEGGGQHNLWMAYYNGSWNGPYDIGKGPLNSDPSASLTISATAHPVVVTWTGTNDNIWYATSSTPWDKNSYSGPNKAVNASTGHLEGPVPGSESPAAAGTCTTDASGCKDEPVFWYDKNLGYLDEGIYDVASDTWVAGPGTARANVLGSDPSATIASYSSNEPIIVWRGSGGGGELWMWDTSGNGGPIGHPECGALGSAPSIVFSPTWTPTYPQGPVFIFWKGATVNTLFEAYESATSGVSDFNCPVNGITTLKIGGDPAS